jgi:hypothetical protein
VVDLDAICIWRRFGRGRWVRLTVAWTDGPEDAQNIKRLILAEGWGDPYGLKEKGGKGAKPPYCLKREEKKEESVTIILNYVRARRVFSNVRRSNVQTFTSLSSFHGVLMHPKPYFVSRLFEKLPIINIR